MSQRTPKIPKICIQRILYVLGSKFEGAPNHPRDPAPLGQQDEVGQGDGLVSIPVYSQTGLHTKQR